MWTAALLLLSLLEPAPASELELRMVELINIEREARGIALLSFSPELAEVARSYSRKMAAAGRAQHGLDKAMEDRIRDAVPDACWFGENVSRHTSIDYSIGDLLLSPGHRENLLSPRFTVIGVGVVPADDGFLYITQEFSRPCAEQSKPRR